MHLPRSSFLSTLMYSYCEGMCSFPDPFVVHTRDNWVFMHMCEMYLLQTLLLCWHITRLTWKKKKKKEICSFPTIWKKKSSITFIRVLNTCENFQKKLIVYHFCCLLRWAVSISCVTPLLHFQNSPHPIATGIFLQWCCIPCAWFCARTGTAPALPAALGCGPVAYHVICHPASRPH